jgi:hypothetical protein
MLPSFHSEVTLNTLLRLRSYLSQVTFNTLLMLHSFLSQVISNVGTCWFVQERHSAKKNSHARSRTSSFIIILPSWKTKLVCKGLNMRKNMSVLEIPCKSTHDCHGSSWQSKKGAGFYQPNTYSHCYFWGWAQPVLDVRPISEVCNSENGLQ